MYFNDLLARSGLEPETVLILRHRPQEDKLRKNLAQLAEEEPALFNAYQRLQTPQVERAYLRAKYVASFVGVDAGTAVFAGLYLIKSARPITQKAFWEIEDNKRLSDKYGMKGFIGSRQTALWFDLELSDFYRDWRGRLTIGWTGKERNWVR